MPDGGVEAYEESAEVTAETVDALAEGRGNAAALLTSATTGFAYLPTCPGTPTGVPTGTPVGTLPAVYDTTAHKIWVFDVAWKATAALA